MLAAFLAALLAPPAPAPATVVAAHAIPGAVVFDLDRGAQVTVTIDDDGAVTAVARDHAGPPTAPRADAPTLPAHLARIDLTADGTRVIVRGDGRAVAIRLTAP